MAPFLPEKFTALLSRPVGTCTQDGLLTPNVTVVPFSLCGRPTGLFGGDWYIGQGVACARIRYGEDEEDVVEVFNTNVFKSHTGCRYGPMSHFEQLAN
jgi:sphingomyelin phosphodiesterase 2